MRSYCEQGRNPNETEAPTEGSMSNDKKPKKAKPAVVHGATNRGSELSGKLAAPVKSSTLSPAKKKK